MSEQLLPCPFCGASGELRWRYTRGRKPGVLYFAGCSGRCPPFPEVRDYSESAAAELWNTRTTPPTGEQEASALDFVMDRIGLSCTITGELRFTDRTINHARAELRTLRAQLSEHKRSIGVLESERDTLRASLAAARAQAFEECAQLCDWRGESALGRAIRTMSRDEARAASEGGRTDTPSSERKT